MLFLSKNISKSCRKFSETSAGTVIYGTEALRVSIDIPSSLVGIIVAAGDGEVYIGASVAYTSFISDEAYASSISDSKAMGAEDAAGAALFIP